MYSQPNFHIQTIDSAAFDDPLAISSYENQQILHSPPFDLSPTFRL